MPPTSGFLFATCQVGAEPALKREMARNWPQFRFAYSRPGFVTFKLPAGSVPPDDLPLESVFARAYGLSLGKATGTTREEMVHEVWRLVGALPVQELHVWPRDAHEPAYHDYEPGLTPAVAEIVPMLREAGPPSLSAESTGSATSAGSRGQEPGARIGRLVADVVLVDEHEWWVGYHRIGSIPSAWPGGLLSEPLPADAVSRVYLKMLEAMRWADFRIRRGQRVIEIGCAPGGASQALLDAGAHVIGIDPAQMHPLVLGHPRFRHIRRRSKEVRRHEFQGVDWLTCDINLPPNYTLDTVEAVIAYPGVEFRGMLLTLKLLEWSMAEKIPEYLERVRSWGFARAIARQLHHNRREVCVAAWDFRGRPATPAATGAAARTVSRPKRGATAAQRKINARPKRIRAKRIGKTEEKH